MTTLRHLLASLLVAACSLQSFAATVTVDVSGTFKDELWESVPGQEYPFKEAFGGSFSGSFSLLDGPIRPNLQVDKFSIFDVNLDVFSADGTLLDTIRDYPDDSEYREFRTNSGLAFLGKPYLIPNRLQDLRLSFEYETTVGDRRLSLDAFTQAVPLRGFIETDPEWDWDKPGASPSWVLEVDKFSMSTSVSGAPFVPSTVPEPRLNFQLLMGLLWIVSVRRR